MKLNKRIGYAAASAVAAAALIGGGAAVANAATTPSPSATGGTGGSTGTSQARGQHTAASADETAKVTAAVKAKDAGATVTKVEKDSDGSFDATATSNGSTVRYEVSADYATVTVSNHGGKGGGQRTPLSSDELAKVTAAIKAKDANATVKDSWKDADGSFDVVVTSGSTTTKYDVSADYSSVTADSGFGQGGGHRAHDGAGSGSASSSPSGATQG
ncbi:hypothetical protein [Sinomonas sp. ASV322]|uniref:hypothetical protein n=1 Tax=Sinomonas sp. ASV322 TaxID=3041920 RepID=UPI0027DB3898|nr:hypothetical protein [Sinomonas sp. ASV322]MDQ4504548.1 hypothetical protein [Sinomonas sp. ASV322]